jgi:hypothetical protein
MVKFELLTQPRIQRGKIGIKPVCGVVPNVAWREPKRTDFAQSFDSLITFRYLFLKLITHQEVQRYQKPLDAAKSQRVVGFPCPNPAAAGTARLSD